MCYIFDEEKKNAKTDFLFIMLSHTVVEYIVNGQTPLQKKIFFFFFGGGLSKIQIMFFVMMRFKNSLVREGT